MPGEGGEEVQKDEKGGAVGREFNGRH
jgi:hypothetical protein